MAQRAVFLFSTGNERYRDVLEETPSNGLVVISYEGQHRFRKYDSIIANPKNNLHLFFRWKTKVPFTYLGMVDASEIVRERSDESTICLRYTIRQQQQSEDPRNKFAPFVGKMIVPLAEKDRESESVDRYPYRAAVFRSFGAMPRDRAYCRQGISVVTLVE